MQHKALYFQPKLKIKYKYFIVFFSIWVEWCRGQSEEWPKRSYTSTKGWWGVCTRGATARPRASPGTGSDGPRAAAV